MQLMFKAFFKSNLGTGRRERQMGGKGTWTTRGDTGGKQQGHDAEKRRRQGREVWMIELNAPSVWSLLHNLSLAQH